MDIAENGPMRSDDNGEGGAAPRRCCAVAQKVEAASGERVERRSGRDGVECTAKV